MDNDDRAWILSAMLRCHLVWNRGTTMFALLLVRRSFTAAWSETSSFFIGSSDHIGSFWESKSVWVFETAVIFCPHCPMDVENYDMQNSEPLWRCNTFGCQRWRWWGGFIFHVLHPCCTTAVLARKRTTLLTSQCGDFWSLLRNRKGVLDWA